LWGRLSRAKQAAFATLLASEQDQRTVVQTLIADIVRTWLQVKELQCQLDLSRRTIANYENSLDLVEQRYVRGLVPPVDVHLSRQNLWAVRAQKPQWEQELATARRRLELLLGRYPAGTVLTATAEETGCVCELPPPLAPLPVGLPSDLLDRRPDIRAAEMRLRAASARIGEVKATLLPHITLTGDSGFRSVELDDLFKAASSVWSLIADLALPVLNRGAQKSQIRASTARTAQMAATYRGAVLNAFGEVEAALQEEKVQQERLRWLAGAVTEARRSLELAEARYRRGLDNLLLTLTTQLSLYNAESEHIRTERLFRTARVNLILALGGPWDLALTGAVAQQEPNHEKTLAQ
jgi:multidrug efflux system outer membrane protein